LGRDQHGFPHQKQRKSARKTFAVYQRTALQAFGRQGANQSTGNSLCEGERKVDGYGYLKPVIETGSIENRSQVDGIETAD